ncbi:putative secreted protein (IPTL-CTERM system target) [Acidovorax sp. 56]|nr:putative secreted protein (IPTL-CTERM system target) [Acidovorax sp. 56]
MSLAPDATNNKYAVHTGIYYLQYSSNAWSTAKTLDTQALPTPWTQQPITWVDPSLQIDQTGRVTIAYSRNDNPAKTETIHIARDNGAGGFTDTVAASGNSSVSSNKLTLNAFVAGLDGRLALAYTGNDQQTIWYADSNNWTSSTKALDPVPGDNFRVAGLAVGANGVAHLLIEDQSFTTFRIGMLTNAGGTWTTINSANALIVDDGLAWKDALFSSSRNSLAQNLQGDLFFLVMHADDIFTDAGSSFAFNVYGRPSGQSTWVKGFTSSASVNPELTNGLANDDVFSETVYLVAPANTSLSVIHSNPGASPRTTKYSVGLRTDYVTFPPSSITYNSNVNTSGSAPTDPASPYVDGSTVVVLGNTGALSKTGAAFAGWNTAADGSGTTYLPGDTFNISQNLTLYARWLHYDPASPSAATVGVAYSQSLAGASGASGPYTYTVTSGGLPAGITLSSSGTLSGTPSAGGTFTFQVTAADTGAGQYSTASQTLSLAVSAPSQTYAPTNPASGFVGSAYSQSLAGASGGTAPYAYTVASGALPPGLTLSTNGVISGTPTTPGSFNFTIQATDSSTGSGPYVQNSGSLTMSISAPTITVAPATVPAAAVGTAYSQTFTASGGTAPYTYSAAGSLPPGLSIAPAGQFSGTPTAGGSYTFTVTATDANQYTGARNYTVTVATPAIVVSPTTISSISAGTQASTALTASGGTVPYSYAITVGSLPAGVSLNTATGALSGNPTVAGTFNFTVTATDSSTGTGPYSGSRAFTWSITAPTLSLAPASGALSGLVGAAFSQTFTASGGNAPYTYGLNVTAGSMPTGLSFATNTGILSGTPTSAGTVTFDLVATDSTTGSGAPYSVIKSYTLTVAAPTIAISPSTISPISVGMQASTAFIASGGTAPYSYAITAGSLPAGVILNTATGVLSGNPTAVGTLNFTVTATDSSVGTGPYSGSRSFIWSITAPTVTVSPSTLPAPVVGLAYSQNLSAAGGAAPYSFAITAGALPPGLTLSSAGVIAGTVTAAGSFNFTVQTTDGNGSTGSASYSFSVGFPTLSLNPSTLPNTETGSNYNQTITASGGTASYSYVVSSGSLPNGLVLSSTGVVSGIATTAGTFNATIRATDSSTGTGAPFMISQPYTIVVAKKTYSAPTSTGSGSATASFTGGGDSCTFTHSQFVGTSAASTAPPNGYTFPEGMFEFTASSCDVHSTLTVTLTYADPVPPNAILLKHSPSAVNKWFTVPATISGNRVTYSVQDGETGDDDQNQNGQIVDPVALAVPLAAAPGNASAIPTLAQWGIALMALLLSGSGMLILRRRLPS